MILGIDIDDTITNTSKTVREYLKAEYPDYDEYKKLPRKEYRKFLKKNLDKMRNEYTLKEGVKEAWEYFKENNFDIIIITARSNKFSRNNIKNTIKFLERHNIWYDKIYFKQAKKGKKAFKNHVDLFIDDKEQVLDGVYSYGITCLCMGHSEKYLSFDNWYQILDYIKEEYHGR